jgi:hypothetical protein
VATLMTEDFEGATAGTVVTAANTAFTAATGSPTYDAAQFMVGTQSALFNPSTGLQYGSYQLGAAAASMSLRWYLRLAALPAALTYLASPLSTSTIRAQVGLNADGTVRIRGGASGTTLVATTTAALSAGTWYRLEWQLDGTGTTQALRIFAGHGTTPISGADISGAFTAGTFDRMLVGVPVSGTITLNMDAVKMTDVAEWIGPAVVTPPSAWVNSYAVTVGG